MKYRLLYVVVNQLSLAKPAVTTNQQCAMQILRRHVMTEEDFAQAAKVR